MIELLFRFIKAMWPFLREMFFGKKGPSDVIRRNKTAVVSVILNALQTIVIFFLIDLTMTLSGELNSTKEAQMDSNSDTKAQLIVLKTTLEQSQLRVTTLESENVLLKTALQNTQHHTPNHPPKTNNADVDRRQSINDRLSRLRGE